ncbi:hypothetical protein ACIQZO_25690 [Streptomyces sp. NPDC097617]|uniref:hypothetical protein n=1 Tax=Streptomyces sp. NPDC097617 TaxID=3366091 RepID=UPI00382C362F
MTRTIDDLLENAEVTLTGNPRYDVGASLRRLATDASRSPSPSSHLAGAARAGHQLSTMCRWAINAPDAAGHISRLAEVPTPGTKAELDVEGAGVFACLLFLTGHPDSAQFWWQLSAGAGNRLAAYCLHLRHLALGEQREAAHWLHEVTGSRSEGGIDDVLLECLGAVASYVNKNGSASSTPPTGMLEMEVDRLGDDGGIVRRPDRRLVDSLRAFASR